MASKDLHSRIEIRKALAPVVIASDTTTTSVAVDLDGYESCEFLIASGVVTDGAYAVLVTECDTTGGSYTAVADADLIGTEALAAFALTDDGEVRKIGYKGSKQFVKVALVSTATTSGGLFSAVAILGHARNSANIAGQE